MRIQLTALAAGMALACTLTLTACGGGGGSSSSASTASSLGDLLISPASANGEPAQPTAVNVQYFPTTTQGNLYSEKQEMFTNLPLTTGQSSTSNEVYVFGSLYAVTIPNLQPTDVVECIAQAEVTNDLGYNVQVDRQIIIGTTNEAYPTVIVTKNGGENLTPDTHHMTINLSTFDTGRSGSVTYSLILSAASTSAQMGDAIQAGQGYGGMTCHVTAS